jgi:GxxExxY protein
LPRAHAKSVKAVAGPRTVSPGKSVSVGNSSPAAVICQTVLIELKSVDRILPVHEAQTLTYLRPSGCKIGLLMNFNDIMLKDGLRRFIP